MLPLTLEDSNFSRIAHVTDVYFTLQFRTAIPSVHRLPTRLTAEYTVALILRSGGENTGASRVRVQPLDDASLLVIVREQADMTIAEGLSDDDGSLLRVEVTLAGLARGQSAANGGSVATR